MNAPSRVNSCAPAAVQGRRLRSAAAGCSKVCLGAPDLGPTPQAHPRVCGGRGCLQCARVAGVGSRAAGQAALVQAAPMPVRQCSWVRAQPQANPPGLAACHAARWPCLLACVAARRQPISASVLCDLRHVEPGAGTAQPQCSVPMCRAVFHTDRTLASNGQKLRERVRVRFAPGHEGPSPFEKMPLWLADSMCCAQLQLWALRQCAVPCSAVQCRKALSSTEHRRCLPHPTPAPQARVSAPPTRDPERTGSASSFPPLIPPPNTLTPTPFPTPSPTQTPQTPDAPTCSA